MAFGHFTFNKKKKLLVFVTILLTVLLGYSVKTLFGINLFNSVSLSSHFPFKFLISSSIITSPKPGILLYDDFEKWRLIKIWSNLWMQKKGKVTKEVSTKGIGNSKCLLIINRSNKSWSYSNRQFIEVRKGDNFSFDGFVKIDGEKAVASIGVSAYDENMKAINWNYIRRKTNKLGMWVKIEKSFSLSEKIKYIRFKLSGFGAAKFYFDNIYLRKQ